MTVPLDSVFEPHHVEFTTKPVCPAKTQIGLKRFYTMQTTAENLYFSFRMDYIFNCSFKMHFKLEYADEILMQF